MTPEDALRVAAGRRLCHAKLQRVAIQERLLDKADGLERDGKLDLAELIRSVVDISLIALRNGQRRINES